MGRFPRRIRQHSFPVPQMGSKSEKERIKIEPYAVLVVHRPRNLTLSIEPQLRDQDTNSIKSKSYRWFTFGIHSFGAANHNHQNKELAPLPLNLSTAFPALEFDQCQHIFCLSIFASQQYFLPLTYLSKIHTNIYCSWLTHSCSGRWTSPVVTFVWPVVYPTFPLSVKLYPTGSDIKRIEKSYHIWAQRTGSVEPRCFGEHDLTSSLSRFDLYLLSSSRNTTGLIRINLSCHFA